ncbi:MULTISPECIES: bifunctional 2-polyprenyl-6-hydroxyphenol methylase/3-demethylubiquinol 3-O-methyltransferase UbiG [unclassified Nocardiopsis]|uniref:class I SAM-dependent methyltransferase n=1 Tax=unclassified Nocardiopsis TaxID=2649073 RepID=UPI001357FB90|nr:MULTISPECIES: class I SAM-dependent methyltransferase [unclassified Nocardiopsis]
MTRGRAHGPDHAHAPQPGPEHTGQEFWDERYRSHERVWGGGPSRHLVAGVSDLPPGRALDAASGEGADAIWLAGRGWEVTAFDISPVGLERAARHAGERGGEIAGRITWTRGDVTRWVPPEGAYDLVTSHYLHLYPQDRRRAFRALASAVAPGGRLLIVAHHARDLAEGVPRPPIPELYFEGEEVLAALREGEWAVLADEQRAAESVLGGKTYTVHDLVVHARRTA